MGARAAKDAGLRFRISVGAVSRPLSWLLLNISILEPGASPMIAASIQRPHKAFPGITNFAYVTMDGGHTWKAVPRANPRKRQQGDDVVAYSSNGLAIHAFIAFQGIRWNRGNSLACAGVGYPLRKTSGGDRGSPCSPASRKRKRHDRISPCCARMRACSFASIPSARGFRQKALSRGSVAAGVRNGRSRPSLGVGAAVQSNRTLS
jgi:hypothetical protein